MKDKILHFSVCFVITAGFAWFGYILWGIVLSILFAIGKEWRDSNSGGYWDWIDIIADAMGILAGILFWRY